MTTKDVLALALEALESIALAGMSGTGQESEEAMTEWHARRAWEFIGIAARAITAIKQAQQAQEPVAWANSSNVISSKLRLALGGVSDTHTWSECRTDYHNQPLYAAPKQAEQAQEPVRPEQVEAAWRAGWAACRDAEYVGQEAEDQAWGMSETCANADWENAAPKQAEPSWKPIESAPKDGTDVLVHCSHGTYVAAYIEHNIEYWHVDDNKYGPFPLRGASPTHWMPLPTPPEAK
jgi:hypothetical protein